LEYHHTTQGATNHQQHPEQHLGNTSPSPWYDDVIVAWLVEGVAQARPHRLF
jgi:hypothetical protein